MKKKFSSFKPTIYYSFTSVEAITAIKVYFSKNEISCWFSMLH